MNRQLIHKIIFIVILLITFLLFFYISSNNISCYVDFSLGLLCGVSLALSGYLVINGTEVKN